MKTPFTSHKRVQLKTLVDTFVNKCTRVNRKQKRSPNDPVYKSKNQMFGWNFFKIFLKGVTAKLNKIALYGVLADLKK
jgi:hypothetical protein